MNKNELLNHINSGREIEFRYGGDMYSITYGTLNGKHVISFCKFYDVTTDVDSADELLNVSRNGVTVLEMVESLSLKDIWIY